MNKQEFVEIVAVKAGITKKDAEAAVKAYHETVTEALAKGEKVSFIGFGNWETVTRTERQGMNLQTGQPMKIPAKRSPKFKPGKSFKDAIK